jgi:Flp pilus assembly pilin Flp
MRRTTARSPHCAGQAREPERRRTDEAGAAAVEFALVLPVLILILFGIIDYGLYFNASLQSRWGVHDAARGAAVSPSQPRGTDSCGSAIVAPTVVERLICQVLSNTDSATAKEYVDVRLPDGWGVGKQLVVCERLDVAGLTGFVPFPNNGQIRDVAVLTIEQDADPGPDWTDPTVSGQDYEDVLPNGDHWDWCTP